ncbi:type VI secretion system tip protein TssI/VgrG [Robbsia sp. KACC 23696]|uniref:type VI secretion system Vgr family protein n=1 Tax=Robbsia sp. KACC 23696 TaxID=3149231 RepID=UPI00325B5EC3
MSDGYTQSGALLSVSTPLGADALLLEQFSGSEGLSTLFDFQLTMRSASADVDMSSLVGAAVTVTLSPTTSPTRYFNGMVTQCQYAGGKRGDAVYLARVVPKLWLLTLGTDRVIYQNLSSAEIVKQILSDNGIAFQDKLSGTYTARDYCVRFDETAFDFISRLMEQDGIFYFFTFTSEAHTLVLADATSAYASLEGAATLSYAPESQPVSSVFSVTQCDLANSLVLQKVSYNDYAYETSATSLLSSVEGASGRGSHYVFPGGYAGAADGQRLAQVYSDAAQVDKATLQGSSLCYMMTAGGMFTLNHHPRTALNAKHVLRSVTHHATRTEYSNAFTGFDSEVTFRAPPRTPRPRVSGMHTAVVVGPSGEEIWTDALGRIKVQMHWDRLGKHDDSSSCWVRVAQTVAGQGWGHLFLPRIGQEVLVSYLDGNPDLPLITGSVYNDVQTTPIALKSDPTHSVIRTRSSKNGTAGNEIRMEDKLDAEQLYVHAQKDMSVVIENDLATTLNTGNETHTITKGNRTIAVQTGNETHGVKGKRDLTITDAETHTNQADFTHTISGNATWKISGDLVIDVQGSISIKSGTTLSLKSGTDFIAEAGASLTNKASTALTNQGGTTVDNKAGTTLTNSGLEVQNKASASQTVDGGGMLTLKGGLVSIN